MLMINVRINGYLPWYGIDRRWRSDDLISSSARYSERFVEDFAERLSVGC